MKRSKQSKIFTEYYTKKKTPKNEYQIITWFLSFFKFGNSNGRKWGLESCSTEHTEGKGGRSSIVWRDDGRNQDSVSPGTEAIQTKRSRNVGAE